MLEWNWRMIPQLCIETGFFEQNLRPESVELVQDLIQRCSQVKNTLEGKVRTISHRLLSHQINQVSDRVLSTEGKIRNRSVQMRAYQLEQALSETSQYMDQDAASREIQELFHLVHGRSLDPETQSCVLRCRQLFLRKFPDTANELKVVKEKIRSIEGVFRNLESLWKEVVSRTVEFALEPKERERTLLDAKIQGQHFLLKEKIASLPDLLKNGIYYSLCRRLGFREPSSMTQENAEKWFSVDWVGLKTVFHQEAVRYLKSQSVSLDVLAVPKDDEEDLSFERKRLFLNVRELLGEIVALPESEDGEVSAKLVSEKMGALWREFQELKKQAPPDVAKELSKMELYIQDPQSFDKATGKSLFKTYEEFIEPFFEETSGLPLDLLKRHMQTGYGVGQCGALLLQQLDSGGDIEGLAELHRLHDAVLQELQECQIEIERLATIEFRDVLMEQNQTFTSHLKGIQGFRKVVSLVVDFKSALKELREKITRLDFSKETQRDVIVLYERHEVLQNALAELSKGNVFWDACSRTLIQCADECHVLAESFSLKAADLSRNDLSSVLKEWFNALKDGTEDSWRVCQRMIKRIRSCSDGQAMLNSICQQVALFAELETCGEEDLWNYPDALQMVIFCALEDRGEKIQ